MKNFLKTTIVLFTMVSVILLSCSGDGGSSKNPSDYNNNPDNGDDSILKEIEMVLIPAGTYMMGSPESEFGRFPERESPQHSVTLTNNFYMGKYQVTQEQYQAVMGSNPSRFTSAVTGESGTPEKLPVDNVIWYETLVFCNKLSIAKGLNPVYRISGNTDPAIWGTVPTSNNAEWNAVEIVAGSNGYRLPTEAEWEYACRAETTTAFNNGNNDYRIKDSINEVAWFYYSPDDLETTHQVGLKTPNKWGLYDMHGNIFEFCWDWYKDDYYSSSPTNNPAGPDIGSYKVIRGGFFGAFGEVVRSAYRSNNSPYSKSRTNGFRLVRSE